MITLDQVQMLEKKVEAIVSKMNDLQRQNSTLQEKNRNLIEQNSLLMQKISSFEADQNRIEQGILNALDRLNSMESSVLKVGTSATQEQNITNIQETQSTQNFDNQVPSTQVPVQENLQNELTNFSNINTEQISEESSFQQQEPSLNFSEDKLDEEISTQEEYSQQDEHNNDSADLGLNFDFDRNVDEENSQGIF